MAVEVRMITLAEAFFERIGVDFNINIDHQGTRTQFSRRSSRSSSSRSSLINTFRSRTVVG